MRRKNEKVPVGVLNCITEAILDKKGNNLINIEVGVLPNAICQNFIICNAESTTQVAAIADNVEEEMLLKYHQKPWHKGGHDNRLWIVLDYVDVVVHIFQTEWREYYKLEELWADAPSVRIEQSQKSTAMVTP